MKVTTLLTYLKVKHDLSKKELNSSKLLFNKRKHNKELIEDILQNSKPLLNTREYIQLSTRNDIDSINVKPDEVNELLEKSISFITLKDYYKLKEELKENNNTTRINAIKNLLNTCYFSLTIEQFKDLIEVSKNKEIDFLKQKLYGRTETKFTNEAIEAQRIISLSFVKLNIEEYKQIIIDSYEKTQSDFPDSYGNVIFVKTPKAELATEILKHSNIIISSFEEYNALRNNISNRIKDIPKIINQEDINNPSIFSQYVLNQNLLYDFGYREKITTKEIYFVTLEEQEDTMSKLLEEKDRFEYIYGNLSLKSDNNFYD